MILNLTQHPASPEQLEAGVVDLAPALRGKLVQFLTFDALPTEAELRSRALSVAYLAREAAECEVPPVIDGYYPHEWVTPGLKAMLGGAPFFGVALEHAIREVGIQPVYAFSVRESREDRLPDGSTKKVSAFRHAGFVLGGPPCR